MNRKSLILKTLLGALTLLLVAGGFNSFQRKRSSFELLDFRFHWNRGIVHIDEVPENTTAWKAGLRPGDQIWVVGGVPASEIDGLKRTLRRGGTVPMLIMRGDRTLTLRYAPPAIKVDYHYLFLTFIGFLYLAIGLYTFHRRATNESSLFFFLTLLAFVVYVYSPAGEVDTKYKVLWIVEEIARLFLPPVALHFFLRFPRPLVENRRILLALYIVPALLAVWTLDLLLFGNRLAGASPEGSFRVIDRWQMLHFAIYFTLAFIALTYTYRTTAAAGLRKQIKWIYLGMAAGFIPFLILYLVPFVLSGAGSGYSTAAILPLALIPLAFAVSILRYRLWDVEVVIKEILAYTVTFVFGMIAFSTVNLFLSSALEDRLSVERNFLAFMSGLLIAGVLVPVKGRIESAIEMILYRETYRHRRAMTEFARELATFHDLHELITRMRERLLAAIHLQELNLYVREGASLILFMSEPGVPERIATTDMRGIAPDRLTVLDEPRLPEGDDTASTLVRAGYRYAFPLRHRGELQGLLLCGTKRNEEPLSRDDLQLVDSLTAPLGLAIENARLYGRLRRQLEEIRSLKEYNENIIESSPSGIAVVTPRGEILTANRAFWELAGSDPSDESTIADLFPLDRISSFGNSGSSEIRFVNRRGQEKEVTISTSPFSAPDAPAQAIVFVITDVSERVKLERELREKERLASLGVLAAGVAHEVNTPLTGISSYAQLLLQETPADDPRHTLLKKMEMQTHRASHLVNNLLDFAANARRPAEEIALPELVATTLEVNDDLLRTRTVSVEVGDIPDVTVRASTHDLQQVLTNLLLNARDAVDAGGHIWISGSVDGGKATLIVRDDGCGIPPEQQQLIFRPLYTSKRSKGGTGLGLAISEKIVTSLGGEIRVQSAPGAGATFFVTLPLSQRA